MLEVLVEETGFDTIKTKVKRPLEEIMIGGVYQLSNNRPFGTAGESFKTLCTWTTSLEDIAVKKTINDSSLSWLFIPK